MPDPSSRFRFNAKAGRYRYADGRFVPRSVVRRVLDRALDAETRRVADLATSLRTQRITLAEWRRGMRDAIKRTQIYSASAARGGWAQMSPADYGRVGQRVRVQYQYLERFAKQIKGKKVRLDGAFQRRAESYAQSARATFHHFERAEMQARGKREERNVLHPAEHCGDCLGETARGWVALGQLSPIGTRNCKSWCRCTIEYR